MPVIILVDMEWALAMTNKSKSVREHPCRRTFLRHGLSILPAGVLLPSPAHAIINLSKHERKLNLNNAHTGERIRTVFWADGHFVPEGLREIEHLLRDFRTGEVSKIDPRLLLLVDQLSRTLEASTPVQIISGYRSPKTNEALRTSSSGVAKKSFHMKGMAIDLRIDGVELKRLNRVARNLKGGGVGFYPKSQFIHIDTGPIRYWT